ncbi:MAG: tetratricopeptide repeat protein [Acidobacteriia bacterium]|nr:tetratricopeptide repeat protein [Terriglobia bacterium]
MTRSLTSVRGTSRLTGLLAAALLVGATLVIYLPAIHGGLIWDDDAHVTRPDLRSLHGLSRIWLELGATQQYYPLAHSAFWLAHRLWGDDTLGYHLANILLHALAAVLVWRVLLRVKIPGAYLAAAVFALHPVHVESVAWITELKNTLSAVFYLGSAWAYLRFDEDRRVRWYVLATGLFVLGLLSKTVTATLPAALLVVFWWRRGRLAVRRDALPLLPWLGMGAAAGLATAWVERALVGAQGEAFSLTAVERCLLAGRVTWFYLGKLLWPANLTFIYPRWEVRQDIAWQYLFPLAAGALVLALWLLRRRWRGPLAAYLFFVGTLFPVLGFLNVYPFRFSFVADHFQYLPSLGPIALASAGIALGAARLGSVPRWASRAPAVALPCVLALLTFRQSATYSDVETLYRTTLARNPGCWMAYNNLGNFLAGEGRNREAIDLLTRAAQLRPDLAEVRNNLGRALLQDRRIPEAVEQLDRALELKTDYTEARVNLGVALLQEGRDAEAIATYERVLDRTPDNAEAHSNLGLVLARQGRVREATEHFERALQLKPGYPEAHFNLGNVLAGAERLDEAIAHYGEAIRSRPDYADAHNNLGVVLLRQSRVREAIEHYERALRIRPDFVEAHDGLGLALVQAGRLPEAIAQYDEALRVRPDSESIRDHLRSAREALARRR